jgi:hypothetical protein
VAAAEGNGHAPPSGLLVSVSEKLLRVLPPAFVGLLLVNVLFIGLVAWIFDHAAENRNALLTKIIDRCLLRDSDAQPR